MIIDYFDYFSQINELLLTDTNILLTGSGQYSIRDIVNILEQEGARVIHWTEDDFDFASEAQISDILQTFSKVI